MKVVGDNEAARKAWRSYDPTADNSPSEVRTMIRAAAAIDRQSEAWVERQCRKASVWADD